MKILIIDDIEENRYYLESLLKGCGYEVVSAINGKDALEKLYSDSFFHMIISDILMPEMDGFQLLINVKADNNLRNIPFVFYTATYTTEKDKEFGLKLGADEYLQKPLDPEEFIRIIQDIIRDIGSGELKPKKPAKVKEKEVFKLYSERLVSKLEKKMLDLEREITERKKAEEELRESEEQYSLVVENCNDAILINQDGIIKFINSMTEKMTGFSKDELLGKSIKDLITPKYRGLVEITYADRVKGKDVPDTYEISLIKKDGSDFPVELSITLINFKNKPASLAFIRDISKRKQAEEERKLAYEEVRKLSTAVEQSPVSIVITDLKANIEYVNPEFTQVTGYTSDEAIGKNPRFLKSGETSPEEYKKLWDTIIEGETWHGEFHNKRKDGILYWEKASIGPIKNESGEITHYIAIFEDITEHRRLEKKLEEYMQNLENKVEERTKELKKALIDADSSRDNIDAILKSISDGLIVTDNYNRVVLMNRIAEDILNVRLSDVINRPIEYAIKEESLCERVIKTLNKKTEYQFDFELQGDNPDHPDIFQARTSLIKDKEEKLNGIITIFHDVSHEREIDRMKTEFISTAAHELRTPLTSIQGFSEILLERDNLDDREKKKFLGHINKQSTNLAQIINDLLDISRIESGKSFSLDKELCLVGETINMVAEPFIAQSKIHNFEIIVSKERLEIKIDKNKISQVLKNLISNAVKYSPDGGEIQIKCEVIEDNLQVSVQDEGLGMTPRQIEKIFDKFYRADTSNIAIEGTGLGMSIVKYIVEAHGGKVLVESEYGIGTKVTFTIPLVK